MPKKEKQGVVISGKMDKIQDSESRECSMVKNCISGQN